jgi:hypothetical protein
VDNARDKLDRLIDGALASYADVEPLAGLEDRVVNRVRVVGARRRIFGWGMGLAVAASVVVVGIGIRTEHRTTPKATSTAATIRLGPVAVAKEPPAASERVRRSVPKRLARPRELPKLEQFPIPSPMTTEERALVGFVQRDPIEAQQIFADLRKRADEPIEIQPIEILPLQSDGAQ